MRRDANATPTATNGQQNAGCGSSSLVVPSQTPPKAEAAVQKDGNINTSGGQNSTRNSSTSSNGAAAGANNSDSNTCRRGCCCCCCCCSNNDKGCSNNKCDHHNNSSKPGSLSKCQNMNNRGTRVRASYSERKQQQQQQQQQQQGTKRRLSRERELGSGYDHRSSGRSSHSARSATTTPGGGGNHSSAVGGSASSTPRDDQDGGGRDSSLSSSHQYNGFSKHRGGGGYNNHHRPKSGSVGSTSSSRSVLAGSRDRRRAENTTCCGCSCCSCCCSRSSVKGSESSFKQHRNHQDCSYNNDGGVYLGEDAEKERQERLQNECESGYCAEDSGNSNGARDYHNNHHHHHHHNSRRRRHSNNSVGSCGNASCKKTGASSCNSSGKCRRRSIGAAKCCVQEGIQMTQRGDDDCSKKSDRKKHCEAAERDKGEENNESPDGVNTPLLSAEPQRLLVADRYPSDVNTAEGVSLLTAPVVTFEQSALTTASSSDIWQLRPCVLPAKETASSSSLLLDKAALDVGKSSEFVVGESTSSCPSVSSSSCGVSTANCSSNVDSSNLICSSFGSGIPNCPNVGSSNLSCLNVSNPNCSSIGLNKINCSSVCSSNPNCSNASSMKPKSSNVCSSDPNCSFAGTGATNCSFSPGTSASGGDDTICSSAHDSKASAPDGLSTRQTLNPTKLEPENSCPILNTSEGKGCVGEHTKGCCAAGASCNADSKCCLVRENAPTTSQEGKSLCKCAAGCCRRGAKDASPRPCLVDSSSGGDGGRDGRIIVNGCGGEAVIEVTDNNSHKVHHVNSFSRNNVACSSIISNSNSKEREAAGTSGLSVSSDILDNRFCSSSPQFLSTTSTTIVSGTCTSHLHTPAKSSSASNSLPSSRVDSSPSDENSSTPLCDCGDPLRTAITSPMEATAKSDFLVSSSAVKDSADRSCVSSASKESNGRPSSCGSPSCHGHHSFQEVSESCGLLAREWPCKATSLPCGESKCHHAGKNSRPLSLCPGEGRGGCSSTDDGIDTRAERSASDSYTRFVQHCHGKTGTCCGQPTNLSCSKLGSCVSCVGDVASEVQRRCCSIECPKSCCEGEAILTNIGSNKQRHSSCRGGTQYIPDHPDIGVKNMADVVSHRVSLRVAGVGDASIRPNRNSTTMVLDYTHALLKDDVPRPRSSFKLDDYHRALLQSLTDDEYQEVFLKHMVLRAGNSAGGSETENASQILDSISQSRLLLQAEAAADEEEVHQGFGFKVGFGEEKLLKWNQNAQVNVSAVHSPQKISSLNGKSKVKKTGSGGENNKERRQLFKSRWWKNLKKKKKKEPVTSEVSSESKLKVEVTPKSKQLKSDVLLEGALKGGQGGGVGNSEGFAEPVEEDETTRMLKDEEVATAKATFIWLKQDRLKLTQDSALKDDQLEVSKKHAHEERCFGIDKFLQVQLNNSGNQSEGDGGRLIAKASQADAKVLPTDAKASQADAKVLPADAKGSQADAKVLSTDAKTSQADAKFIPTDAIALPVNEQKPQTKPNSCSDIQMSQDEDKRASQTRSQKSLPTEQVREQKSKNEAMVAPAENVAPVDGGLWKVAPQENVNLRTTEKEVAARDGSLVVCDLSVSAASVKGPAGVPPVTSCEDTGSQASAVAPQETGQGSYAHLEASPLKTE